MKRKGRVYTVGKLKHVFSDGSVRGVKIFLVFSITQILGKYWSNGTMIQQNMIHFSGTSNLFTSVRIFHTSCYIVSFPIVPYCMFAGGGWGRG